MVKKLIKDIDAVEAKVRYTQSNHLRDVPDILSSTKRLNFRDPRILSFQIIQLFFDPFAFLQTSMYSYQFTLL